MKKFKLQFSTKPGGENYNEVKIIQAESCEVAVQQFVEASKNTCDQYVLASGYGFLNSEGIHLNPYYNQPQKIDVPKPTVNNSNSEEQTANLNYIQLEKLDKLIEIQEKQLGWIRIIALPVLLSIIFFFLRILTGRN
jgi:hypothetical protein